MKRNPCSNTSTHQSPNTSDKRFTEDASADTQDALSEKRKERDELRSALVRDLERSFATGTLFHGGQEIDLDGRVLLYTLGLSLLTGIAAGLLPATGLAKDAAGGVRGAGRGSSGGGARIRRVLVAGEIAVSIVLVIGAGLLTRSFAGLQSVDPGFDPEGVVVAPLTFGEPSTPEELIGQLDEVLDAVRGRPHNPPP